MNSMQKTRMNYGAKSGNKTMKNKKCCITTYKGLHKWFHSAFEKLGWMILAKSKGHMGKINGYKEELHHLQCAIDERLKVINDADKKQDLIVLKRDLSILVNHVNGEM